MRGRQVKRSGSVNQQYRPNENPLKTGKPKRLRARQSRAASKGSVSTWTPENVLNRELVQTSRVVILVSLLIRWVKNVNFGIWQRQPLRVLIVGRRLGAPDIVRNAVLSVVDQITYVCAKNVGRERTRNAVMIKQEVKTTLGKAGYLPRTTNVLQKSITATNVTVVVLLLFSLIIETRTDRIARPKILNASVKDATKLTCMSAHETSLSFVVLQRYSQYPGKPGIITLNYGEGPKKLGLSLGITDIEEAKALIARYFAPYPNIEKYIKDTHYRVKRDCFVETIIGRPRRFPDMKELGFLTWEERQLLPGKLRATYSQIERQSVNSIIQGSAADIAKQAMILCDADVRLKELGAELLLQIHDELIFEVPEKNVEEARVIIKELMEHPLPFELRVPLTVDSGYGYSWAAAKA